jgi:hypothetical protein
VIDFLGGTKPIDLLNKSQSGTVLMRAAMNRNLCVINKLRATSV